MSSSNEYFREYNKTPRRKAYMKEYREKNKEEYKIYINDYFIERRKRDNLFRLIII